MGTLRSLTNYRMWSYVTRDGDAWVGHCLAVGVVSQADTVLETIVLLADCVEETISGCLDRGGNPFVAFRPSAESVAEFESIRARALHQCNPREMPPDAESAIFELVVPMPKQAEGSKWAMPTDPFDVLTVPVQVAS